MQFIYRRVSRLGVAVVMVLLLLVISVGVSILQTVSAESGTLRGYPAGSIAYNPGMCADFRLIDSDQPVAEGEALYLSLNDVVLTQQRGWVESPAHGISATVEPDHTYLIDDSGLYWFGAPAGGSIRVCKT
jgi:hypothetical protein